MVVETHTHYLPFCFMAYGLILVMPLYLTPKSGSWLRTKLKACLLFRQVTNISAVGRGRVISVIVKYLVVIAFAILPPTF